MSRIERTDVAQQDFNRRTGEVPVITNGAAMDPFADDEPIVPACDLENPESCESCQ